MGSAVEYTKQQQQVITLRDRNLLVSAAAGSGKTAVLVERILTKITDPNQPIDIDRLLIVTFTNAAAGEMRERILAAIETALDQNPEDPHLLKQHTLIHNAQITTIHSFCLYIIRNYFHRIDIEPDFSMGDEGEMRLMQQDVLANVLEEYYLEKDKVFIRLSETLAIGKTDLQLQDLILNLYTFSMSHPWPEEWLGACAKPYQAADLTAFEQLPLAAAMREYVKAVTSQWVVLITACTALCQEADGPEIYLELLEKEQRMLEEAARFENLAQLYHNMCKISFGRLPAARKYTGDLTKKQLVQDTRKEIKESLKKMMEQFFLKPPQELVGDLSKNKEIITKLIEVTNRFAQAFAEKKREKNKMDFNDLEHFTLQILVDPLTKVISPAARELRGTFDEIMIDEYQDSNLVQETILKAVSGESEGRHNLFMVGDVKQSIYRFRMARPELFMEKYDNYSPTEGPNQRIDLHKNFRSRQTILATVNDIFYAIMGKDLGNVEYDDQAALYPGMEFPEASNSTMFDTEILAADMDAFFAATEETGAALDTKEIEAKMIAAKITQMKSEQVVTDSATKALRPMEYQDVAILLRSPGSFGEQLAQILIDYGIPAQVASSSGYFSTIEVQTILNMLRLIDNPRQDIPLAAVLKSYIGGVSGEELAKIRIAALEQPFYKAVMDYADQGEDKALAVKLAQFFTVLNGYRDKVCDTPIHELLFQVMDETGYLDYVYALPGGKIRRANLEMLLEKAIAYESTSYRGLFHFIRYMNQLETYQVDYGEASEDSKENAVQIYSIHKSKGLEFPIVFVAGMGRQFNQQDSRSMLVLHPQLGIGLDVTDTIRRTRTPALTRQILARQIKLENAGEELRVLYVALTRAREKLVISGTLKKAEKKLAAGMELSGEQHGKLGFLKRLQASCYFDWILPALKRKPKDYPITLIDPGYLAVLKLTQQLEQEMDLLQLKQQLAQTDPSWQQKIAERLSFQYAYCGEENNKTKMTVSEMKHRALDQLQQVEESGELLYEEKPMNPYVPDFMQDTHDETIAVRRGTAMHRVLECLDFSLCQNTLKEQIAQLVQQRKLDETMAAFVSVPALEQFFRSELAQRMKAAATVGLFYREQPFIMGKPSCEVLPGTKSSELILIQGIIDAFFEEHGELVLVEYKTDRVKQAQELVQRYHIQMDLYQEALERAWGKKVKERYLYSFCLQKEIRYEKG